MDDVLTADDIGVAIDGLLRRFKGCDSTAENAGDARIESIDHTTKCLQIALDAVQRELQACIARSRQQRNDETVFHRLPAEVILTIFQFALVGETKYYFRKLFKIRGVSSGWRAIVMGSPALWAFIYITGSFRSINKQALERSKNYPLEVDSFGRFVGEFQASQLGPEMSRIRSLRLNFYTENVLDFANGPAPSLGTLHLTSSTDYFDTEGGVDLFKGQAPRLQNLTLWGVSILWDSAILGGLQSLDLSNTDHGPSANRLLHILSQAPELTRLTLELVVFAEDDSFDPTTSSPIILPRLILLRIRDLTPTDMLAILDKIRVPACRDLNLSCRAWSNATIEVPAASITHLKSSIVAIMAVHDLLDIELLEDTFLLGSRSSEPRVEEMRQVGLWLQFPIRHPTQYLRFIADLPSTPIVSIKFGGIYVINQPTIFSPLNEMNVTSLVLETLGNVDAMIQHLSRPTTDGSSRQRWSFPNLRHIYIRGTFDKRLLLEMLERRYGWLAASRNAQNGEVTKRETDLPVPLGPLTFDGPDTMDAITFERVKEILGPRVAEWVGVNEDGIEDEDEDGMRMRTIILPSFANRSDRTSLYVRFRGVCSTRAWRHPNKRTFRMCNGGVPLAQNIGIHKGRFPQLATKIIVCWVS